MRKWQNLEKEPKKGRMGYNTGLRKARQCHMQALKQASNYAQLQKAVSTCHLEMLFHVDLCVRRCGFWQLCVWRSWMLCGKAGEGITIFYWASLWISIAEWCYLQACWEVAIYITWLLELWSPSTMFFRAACPLPWHRCDSPKAHLPQSFTWTQVLHSFLITCRLQQRLLSTV